MGQGALGTEVLQIMQKRWLSSNYLSQVDVPGGDVAGSTIHSAGIHHFGPALKPEFELPLAPFGYFLLVHSAALLAMPPSANLTRETGARI